MKKFFKSFILSLLFLFTLNSCGFNLNSSSNSQSSEINKDVVSDTFDGITYTVYKDKPYNSKYEVAIYINYFHTLPNNYFTKAENKKYNYLSQWTSENKYSIGGDRFMNREGRLPSLPKGEYYTECDINSRRTTRGAYRIVFSSLYDVYYTHDHYNTFEKIY